VPAAAIVTIGPTTVQMAGVSELNETARPELAVACTANGVLPYLLDDGAGNVIAWALPAVTAKLRVTVGADAYAALPAWSASIVHVPAPTSVTVDPATLHTPGVPEPNDTGRPELAVALTVNVWSVSDRSGSGSNAIVCSLRLTLKWHWAAG